MNNDWLGPLSSVMGLNASIVRELGSNLEPALVRLGLDPATIHLVPQADHVAYDARGAGTIEADLVGPDAWGHPVSIEFSCANHASERVDLSRPLPSGCALIARWSKLPEAELRARYRAPPPFLKLPHEIASRVDWGYVNWPEVRLRIVVAEAEQADAEDRAARALRKAFETWGNSGQSAIEFVSPVTRAGAGGFEASIDFGAAPRQALQHVLAEVLRAFPAGRIRAGT